MKLVDIEDFKPDEYEVLIIHKGDGRTVATLTDFPEVDALTKEEVIAMFTKLQLEIEEKIEFGEIEDPDVKDSIEAQLTEASFLVAKEGCEKIIQKKINTLKEEITNVDQT